MISPSNQVKLSVAAFLVGATFALTGCGQLLEKLRGGGDAGSDASAEDSGAVADTSDAGAATADAAVEAGATTGVTFHAGDQIPTFNADEAAAAKEINSQNYKTQLVTLDQQVKALK
jgi:hypothetical protein